VEGKALEKIVNETDDQIPRTTHG